MTLVVSTQRGVDAKSTHLMTQDSGFCAVYGPKLPGRWRLPKVEKWITEPHNGGVLND